MGHTSCRAYKIQGMESKGGERNGMEFWRVEWSSGELAFVVECGIGAKAAAEWNKEMA